MNVKGPLLPQQQRIHLVRSGDVPAPHEGQTLASRDHDVIRKWAERRQASPATGEASASGPSTVDIHDGGAGIRFNFPSVSPFREISWQEWFEHFDAHGLTFVYEEGATGDSTSHRYRLVKTSEWEGQFESM